jgi:hypothetical protein
MPARNLSERTATEFFNARRLARRIVRESEFGEKGNFGGVTNPNVQHGFPKENTKCVLTTRTARRPWPASLP